MPLLKDNSKFKLESNVIPFPGYQEQNQQRKKRITTVCEAKSTKVEIDKITGEYKESIDSKRTVNSYSKTIEPNYIKLYIGGISYLNGLQTSQNDVLYALLSRMTYDSTIVVNKGVKKRISDETKKSIKTIDNNITTFVKKGIIVRLDRGIYIVNPIIFAKGKWTDIVKIIDCIEYNTESIKINSDFEKVSKEIKDGYRR